MKKLHNFHRSFVNQIVTILSCIVCSHVDDKIIKQLKITDFKPCIIKHNISGYKGKSCKRYMYHIITLNLHMGPLCPIIVEVFLGSNSDFLHDILFQDEWKDLYNYH